MNKCRTDHTLNTADRLNIKGSHTPDTQKSYTKYIKAKSKAKNSLMLKATELLKAKYLKELLLNQAEDSGGDRAILMPVKE